jgi:mono/diheme cytochrome c family protein
LSGLATAVVVAIGASPSTAAAQTTPTSAKSDYLGQCGGCHGLQGDTSPAPVPVLRGRVGYFMRSAAGRNYLIRLPNVSRARVDDDALAAMMNFVVAAMGPDSGPAKIKRFSAEEVRKLRQRPMFGAEIEATRQEVVDELVRNHRAPASLRLSYPGEERAFAVDRGK